MPLHVAPVLRNRELALEAAGLLVATNSVGYTTAVNQETNGQKIKTIPLVTYKFNGNSFDARE